MAMRVACAVLALAAGLAAATDPSFDGKLRDVDDGSTEAYMVPPYKANHASTLEVLPDGTLACAWFSGEAEEAPGCAIVVATLAPGADEWSTAQTVSKDEKYSNQNPVLFYDTQDSTLHLFHSHAPAQSGESQSTIFHLTSTDKGNTWSKPAEWLAAPGGFPRNRIIEAPDGGVIFPFYNASNSPTFDNENYAIMGVSGADRSWDPATWDFIAIKGSSDLVQPTVVQTTSNSLISFFRDRRAQHIYRADGDASGRKWTVPDTSSGLPNNNAGIEANVITSSNRIVLAYNPQTSGRDPLAVALSDDGGHTWPYSRNLQHGDSTSSSDSSHGNEFSYPSTLVTYDAKTGAATLHVTYTYNRDTIKYKKFTEDWVINKEATPAAAAIVEDVPVETAAAHDLERWVAREMEHHERLLTWGELEVAPGVSNGTQLPPGCNFTLPNHTTTVLCVANADSPKYDPIGMAAAISRVPGVQALSFAVDVAPTTGPALTDQTLQYVAANLNSSTVTTLHVFVGALAFVSDSAIAQFTALNPTVWGLVTDLGFALERNQLSDANLQTMGNIIGHQYQAVTKLSLDLANQFSSNITGDGITRMFNLMLNAHTVTDLWVDISGNDITESLRQTGQVLGQWRSLTALNFTNQNRALGPQVDDEGFLDFMHGVFVRGNGSALTNFTVDFTFNNVTDAGLVVSASLFGSNLSSVSHMVTVLDNQQEPISPAGVYTSLQALGAWQNQPGNVWDLSIQRPAQGNINATHPNGTIPPKQVIAPGSPLAKLTDALSCTTNPAFFGEGVRLTQLSMPPKLSYCEALAVASRAPAPLPNGTNRTCPPGHMMLAYHGKFVDICNLTDFYCGNCTPPPPPPSGLW